MHRLDLKRIDLDMPLPGAILSEEGRVLVPAGKLLDADAIARLRSERGRGLYGRDEWGSEYRIAAPAPKESETLPEEEPRGDIGELVPTSVDQLKLGSKLPTGLYRHDGVMLLAEGMPITSKFLARLRQQGIFEVCMPRPDEKSSPSAVHHSFQTRTTVELDRVIDVMSESRLIRRMALRPRPRLGLRDFRGEVERGRDVFRNSIDEVGTMFADILRRQRKTVSAARNLMSQFLDFTRLDQALLPSILDFHLVAEDYLYPHGINVALLAMNTATELAYPSEDILEIGLGSLLQDVGMMQVSNEVRFAPRWLNDRERKEIGRHPVYSLSCLDAMEGISEPCMMISYQSHERPNSSGYPRGQRQERIHPYARLVAASDAYSALNAHRPHRNARTPHDAVHVLLREAKLGRFDAEALRIFLDGMSIFPVGSYVRLTNGQGAQVLRANPGQHTRPVVVPVDEHGSPSDDELDLSEDTNYAVAEALREIGELKLKFEVPGERTEQELDDAVLAAINL